MDSFLMSSNISIKCLKRNEDISPGKIQSYKWVAAIKLGGDFGEIITIGAEILP